MPHDTNRVRPVQPESVRKLLSTLGSDSPQANLSQALRAEQTMSHARDKVPLSTFLSLLSEHAQHVPVVFSALPKGKRFLIRNTMPQQFHITDGHLHGLRITRHSYYAVINPQPSHEAQDSITISVHINKGRPDIESALLQIGKAWPDAWVYNSESG